MRRPGGRGPAPAGWSGTPWEELERPGPDFLEIGGVEVRRGSRVRLRPRTRGDVFDGALAGRTAVVEKVEQDMEGLLKLAVVVEDDPGRDLGAQRQPGHRFFFDPEEVEPLGPAGAAEASTRVLVAGIGNVFLGDDGFGVALANRLAASEMPPGVEVADFGIRGMDLAWAMQDGYDAVILLDALPRGGEPGSLYLIEPEVEPGARPIDAHGMDPVTVLSLVHALGGTPPRTLVVGCEPGERPADGGDVAPGLSEPVRAALDEGMRMVETALEELASARQRERSR
ncbi:MAG: hydrogenase maturation protease [Solirubrobacterales bacterium]